MDKNNYTHNFKGSIVRNETIDVLKGRSVPQQKIIVDQSHRESEKLTKTQITSIGLPKNPPNTSHCISRGMRQTSLSISYRLHIVPL